MLLNVWKAFLRSTWLWIEHHFFFQSKCHMVIRLFRMNMWCYLILHAVGWCLVEFFDTTWIVRSGEKKNLSVQEWFHNIFKISSVLEKWKLNCIATQVIRWKNPQTISNTSPTSNVESWQIENETWRKSGNKTVEMSFNWFE